MGRLDIRICAARNLPDTEAIGEPDPYCVVRLEHQVHRTSTCDDTTDPQWNEVFKFTVADPDSSQIRFELWNKNMISDEFLGHYTLSISGLKREEVKEGWFLLQQCKTNAELHIRMKAMDFGDIPEPTGQPMVQMGGYAAQEAPQMGRVPNDYHPPAPAPYQQAAPGGYPPQQQPGYPPQQQPGYPPQQQPGYPPQQQPGYPPQQQPGYPPQQQPGYPPQQQPGYPPQQQPGYPPQQQPGYPPQQQPGYPPQQQHQPQMGGAPPGFNGEEYIQLHSDLAAAVGGNPDRHGWAVTHWNDFGHNEGRAYSRSMMPYDWNPETYLNKYPDLMGAAAGQPDRNGFAQSHWLNHGVTEGRCYR